MILTFTTYASARQKTWNRGFLSTTRRTAGLGQAKAAVIRYLFSETLILAYLRWLVELRGWEWAVVSAASCCSSDECLWPRLNWFRESAALSLSLCCVCLCLCVCVRRPLACEHCSPPLCYVRWGSRPCRAHLLKWTRPSLDCCAMRPES